MSNIRSDANSDVLRDAQGIDLAVDALAHRAPEYRAALVEEVVRKLPPEDLHDIIRSLESAGSRRLHEFCLLCMAEAAEYERNGDLTNAQARLQLGIHCELTNAQAHKQLAQIMERRRAYSAALNHYVFAMHFSDDDDDLAAAVDRVRACIP